jgi:protein-L-isoaspartate(D-aspartate) O-methyltransferase
VGDGSLGLPDEAPFDAIVVTAGGPSLPPAFSKQLAEGGRIVMPIGPMHDQRMCRFTKRHGLLQQEDLGAFCFVPLIGEEAWPDDSTNE